MYRFFAASVVAFTLFLTPVATISAQTGQDPASAPATAVAAAPGREIVIPDGTEIACVTIEEISSKTATEGDPLTFKVDEDLVIGGATVISKGTIVKAEVSSAKKNGMMGKSGSLSIRVLSTLGVDGQKIKLRASKGSEGEGKTGATVALVVVFGVLGFLKHGKNAKIKPGTRITAYTDEAKTVVLKPAV